MRRSKYSDLCTHHSKAAKGDLAFVIAVRSRDGQAGEPACVEANIVIFAGAGWQAGLQGGRGRRSGTTPLQVGARGTGPAVQSAILAVRSWASSLGTTKVMLKLDVKNAFNNISRRGCLREVGSRCPALLPWASWLLSGGSFIFWGTEKLMCTIRVQQGHPISPVVFASGLQGAIEQLAVDPDIARIWCLDDGLIVGTPEAVDALSAVS